jgi:flagellar assembly protein FliH
MGASEKFVSGLIPKEQVGDAAAWQFQPLAGKVVRTDPTEGMSERERRAYERGRKEGFDQGVRATVDKARREHAGQAAQLERVLHELRARFIELESDGADALLDLALEIARQVVRRDIAVQRDAVLPPLREAIALVIDQQAHPRVHLNPHDLDPVRADLDTDGAFKGCRFIAYASVARGGCRVETHLGEIDATLATRWQRVLAALGIEADSAP